MIIIYLFLDYISKYFIKELIFLPFLAVILPKSEKRGQEERRRSRDALAIFRGCMAERPFHAIPSYL